MTGEHVKTLAELAQDALAFPADQPAIDFEQDSYTWGDVARVAAQARAAIVQAGLGDGCAVSFVPRNRPSALATLTGLLAGGHTVRMIYAFQSAAGIAAAVEQLDSPVVIIGEDDLSDELKAVMASNGMACVVMGPMDARLHPDFASARPRPVPAEPTVDILTSGTTGTPKQFPILHSVFAKYVLAQGMTLLADPNDPPFLFSFPIGNISGMYSTCGTFLRGRRTLIVDRFTLDVWLGYVKRYKVTQGGAPPAAVAMILDRQVPKEDLATIQYFSTGAAPLDPTIHRRFEDTYGIPVLLSYGATEFGGPVVAMTPALHAEYGAAKFGSVGRPMPGVQLRLRDPETDEILPPGNEGLLDVVSPRMGPEWIRTADVVFIDEDGFVFCRGRADGAIMRGGFKVLPETIERALLEHPAISAAGVVAVPDPRLHEVPGAVIELQPGAQNPGIAALEDHLRDRVLKTHLPVHWRFVDSLPKNPSFKIDRPALKRLFVESTASA